MDLRQAFQEKVGKKFTITRNTNIKTMGCPAISDAWCAAMLNTTLTLEKLLIII